MFLNQETVTVLAKKDRQTLEAAGIDDIDRLAAAAAAFLRDYPLYTAQVLPNALSADEEAFLKQGGAVGVGDARSLHVTDTVEAVAGEYAQMVAGAYTQRQTAELLGVTTSRIRQRIDEHSLYTLTGPGGRVCPRFQFADNATLRGLEAVLAALSPQAHPVAVQRFFLGVSADLDSETLGRPLSPRDWLLTGHAVEPVVILAREL